MLKKIPFGTCFVEGFKAAMRNDIRITGFPPADVPSVAPGNASPVFSGEGG